HDRARTVDLLNQSRHGVRDQRVAVWQAFGVAERDRDPAAEVILPGLAGGAGCLVEHLLANPRRFVARAGGALVVEEQKAAIWREVMAVVDLPGIQAHQRERLAYGMRAAELPDELAVPLELDEQIRVAIAQRVTVVGGVVVN